MVLVIMPLLAASPLATLATGAFISPIFDIVAPLTNRARLKPKLAVS